MQFSIASTASFLALLSTASARITALAVPTTIAAGEYFPVKLLTENYNQAVYDVATAFGISPGAGFPNTLGTPLGAYYIGPALSNTLNPLNFTLRIDPGFPAGPATIVASVYSLYGAVSSPALVPFNVTITVGTVTSTDFAFSV
ncbi:hypothetical protein JHW43_005294 [Diplocarpon mali]|nr:hypothetical protein JHW43_005294 [Diplocarpon mali]